VLFVVENNILNLYKPMIKTYASRIPKNADLSQFGDIISHLSDEKRDRVFRFIKKDDALRALVGEKLIRMLISENLGLSIDEIILKNDKFGKPYLSGSDGFYFNISHSGEFVVCAISSKPVGIDVEQVLPIDFSIAKNYFSPVEYNDLMMQNDSKKLHYFYDLWTLKESYLKARGCGITVPLDSFTFRISGSDFQKTGIPDEYCFKRYNLEKNYKSAVCGTEEKFAEEVLFIEM
jgi:4'-phosphopantetheinyl transferase